MASLTRRLAALEEVVARHNSTACDPLQAALATGVVVGTEMERMTPAERLTLAGERARARRDHMMSQASARAMVDAYRAMIRGQPHELADAISLASRLDPPPAHRLTIDEIERMTPAERAAAYRQITDHLG